MLNVLNTGFWHRSTTVPLLDYILVNFLIHLTLWRINKIIAFNRVPKMINSLIGDILHRIWSYLHHIATELSRNEFFLDHYLGLWIFVFTHYRLLLDHLAKLVDRAFYYLSVAVVILHLHKSTRSLIKSTWWVAMLLRLRVLRIFRFWAERVSIPFTFTLTASQSMVRVCQYLAS